MVRNGLLLICCFLLLIACEDSKRKQFSSLVQEWEEKEILFPENPIFTRFATDTTFYRIPKSEYKVVVYVDSFGCISCKLQLPKWKEFISKVDSLSGGKVPFLFFFQPRDMKSLHHLLLRDDFSLPICVDANNEFDSLNHFPREIMFQSFLLDKDNCVIVIGNPVHNLSVRDLYIRNLLGTKQTTSLLTILKANAMEYNLGVVREKEDKSQVVMLKNVGKEKFVMKGVTTSCDCMSVDYDWSEIGPGETATLTAIFKPETKGEFWRTITIYGNIPNESMTLGFVGKVI